MDTLKLASELKARKLAREAAETAAIAAARHAATALDTDGEPVKGDTDMAPEAVKVRAFRARYNRAVEVTARACWTPAPPRPEISLHGRALPPDLLALTARAAGVDVTREDARAVCAATWDLSVRGARNELTRLHVARVAEEQAATASAAVGVKRSAAVAEAKTRAERNAAERAELLKAFDNL